MPIFPVLLSASASEIDVNPTVKVTQGGDQIEFTARDFDFTIIINNDDDFFPDISGDWKQTVHPGQSITTPVINGGYGGAKDYTVTPTLSTATPVIEAPGRIIVGI